MTRYFFWKGRMPAGITARSRAGADEWLAYPPNQGGFGLWSPMDHLTAVRACTALPHPEIASVHGATHAVQ
jgi:hypothetical protein